MSVQMERVTSVPAQCYNPWPLTTFWKIQSSDLRHMITPSGQFSKKNTHNKSNIWKAARQHCCRSANNISKQLKDINIPSCGFENNKISILGIVELPAKFQSNLTISTSYLMGWRFCDITSMGTIVQERRNSCALAMELCLSYINPSI